MEQRVGGSGDEDDRLVTVFMVRHGQRIDETSEGRAWQLQAGDRWYDPPLTEEGKRQAFDAASNLVKFLRDCAAAGGSISGGGGGGGGGGEGGGVVAAASAAGGGAAVSSDEAEEEAQGREEQQQQQQQQQQHPSERKGVVFDVFPRVFCSPLLRTLSTAEQFGRVFKMPVVPVAGLATCTAVFRKRGREQVLLPFQEVVASCRDAVLEDFSPEYTDMLFEPTVAALACQATTAAEPAAASNASASSAGEAQQATGSTSGGFGPEPQGQITPKRRRRAIIVVTHREGLRNTSKLTGAPFQKTKYCCTAMFNYRLPPAHRDDSCRDGAATPPPTPKPTELWSLAYSPESFEALQRALRIRRKIAESDSRHVQDFHSLKRQLKSIQASLRERRAHGDQRSVDELLDAEALVVASMHVAAQAGAMQSSKAQQIDGHRPVPIEDWNACGDEISAPPPRLPDDRKRKKKCD